MHLNLGSPSAERNPSLLLRDAERMTLYGKALAHVFAGPLSPGEALIVQYLSKCWKWYFESRNRPPSICLFF